MIKRRRVLEGALGMAALAAAAPKAEAFSIETLPIGGSLANEIADHCSTAQSPEHTDLKRQLLKQLQSQHALAGTSRAAMCPICGCTITVTAGS